MDKNQFFFGRNAVLEALQQNHEIEKVFLQKKAHGEVIDAIQALCHEHNIAVQRVPEVKLDHLTKGNHQGVVALAALVKYYNIQDIINQVYDRGEDPLLLILDQLTDVRNVGAIARTALGMGVHALVLPMKGSAIIHADAVKASSGALLKLPLCRVDNLHITLKDLKNNGIAILGLEASSNQDIAQIQAAQPMALVLGSEGEGISPAVQKLIDQSYTIPIQNELESYNVSVAAGISLYEIHRKRKEKG